MTTNSLQAYLPQDRLEALEQGQELPTQTTGAALFADISGFTPLTEKLTRQLGPRRGAEELSRQLNAVYDALIAEIEKRGGSVISFAGDAITCWFDGDPGRQAVGAAMALQTAMAAFPQLGIKATVTSGPARRFRTGDPAIQWLDALAGATVARLAIGEHLASRGEVVIDAATAEALAGQVRLGELRLAETGERFAIVERLETEPALTTPGTSFALAADILRPWILPAIFERDQSGHSAFLTELRPAVALFLRFTGIDYDGDEHAGNKLDAFICRAQAVVTPLGGAILQLSIGDKGSYFYAVFGAPITHEDDVHRAIQAALALRVVAAELDFLAPVEIGISQGTMRVGAYGGVTRRTYGTLGDDVNLAARLMTAALPGEIVVSAGMRQTLADRYHFEPRPPLQLKGKTEPVPVFTVTGQRQRRAIRLEEPHHLLPIMGRQAELALTQEKLGMALKGQGQIIGITAEAGVGKSRLVAEVIRQAHKAGFTGYGGACESSGMNTPYLVWKSIWQAFFDVDPAAPPRRQLRNLEGEIEDHAPTRVSAIPVLSPLLDISIEDNDFTSTLEPKDRRNVLTAILEECLKSALARGPLLFVLEDLHWMDALSQDLLETLARASANLPVCFVLAYRPPDNLQLQLAKVEDLPNFTKVPLGPLASAEAEQLIRAKLAQLFPAHVGTMPAELLTELITRSEGNPFYLQELLNYLRDRNINPFKEGALKSVDLPASLHTLVLSRIDRLPESEKAAIKTASIIGRSFSLTWLRGYYPTLGAPNQVGTDLEKLAQLDLTPLDTPEPDLRYLFKHMVTREVAYESLPHAMRTELHERFAGFIEDLGLDQSLPLLAYHYSLGNNRDKQREYLQKAGDATLAVCSYRAALDYFTRLLPLLEEPQAHVALLVKLAEVHFRLSNYPAAHAALEEALRLSTTADLRASALALLGEITSQNNGDYAGAKVMLVEALSAARDGTDKTILARVLYALGDANWRLGDLDAARTGLEESLELARAIGDSTRALFALNRLAIVTMSTDLDEAERMLKETHAEATRIGNRERMMAALSNLGGIADQRGDMAAALALQQQALAIAREIGGRQDAALFLLNISSSAISLKDFPAARSALRDGLSLARELGALPWVIGALMYMAKLTAAEGQCERALALLGLCQKHPACSLDIKHEMESILADWNLDAATVEAGLAQGAELDFDRAVEEVSRELELQGP